MSANAYIGAADLGNPQLVAGSDGTRAITLRTNAVGELLVQDAVAADRVTVQASAAKTATNSSAALVVGNYREAIATLNVTAASGTTPTLDVKLQTSDDGGTTWYDLPGGVFTQRTAAGAQALQITNFGDTLRAVSTIGGTTPSFTYAIKLVAKP